MLVKSSKQRLLKASYSPLPPKKNPSKGAKEFKMVIDLKNEQEGFICSRLRTQN